MTKPEIKVLDEHHCLATWHNVLIQIWRKETTAKSVAKLSMVTREFMLKHKTTICSISVVERSSPPPEPDIRNKLAAFYKEHAPKMHVAVVVSEGGGFRNAIVRGVGLTLTTLAPQALPFQFAANVSEGAKIIAPHLPPEARGGAGLEKAISDLKSEIPTSAAALA